MADGIDGEKPVVQDNGTENPEVEAAKPNTDAEGSHMEVEPEIKSEADKQRTDAKIENTETTGPKEGEPTNESSVAQGGENEGEEVENDDDNDEDDEGTNERDSKDSADLLFDQVLMKPLFERRDKSLKELLESMDEFAPIIPDAVADYYLAKSGFKTTDHRVKRLLALATQKFVADIASDAYQFARIRAQTANAAGGSGRGRAGPGSTSGRTVLTMESLSGVLGEYGINAKRPDFYR